MYCMVFEELILMNATQIRLKSRKSTINIVKKEQR